MNMSVSPLNAEEWLTQHVEGALEPVVKSGTETKVWFASLPAGDLFVKWYPSAFASWAETERVISFEPAHQSIVPLRSVVHCADGDLFFYGKVNGENLNDGKRRFAALPVAYRLAASLAITEALASVCERGFTVVDWYEGNMIYDFDTHRIWLFDWDLCRRGKSFILEMESNYGSSRLMAPEEFVRGSVIDEQTLVFNLGRFLLLNVPELAEQLANPLSRATYPSKSGRFARIQDFVEAINEVLFWR